MASLNQKNASDNLNLASGPLSAREALPVMSVKIVAGRYVKTFDTQEISSSRSEVVNELKKPAALPPIPSSRNAAAAAAPEAPSEPSKPEEPPQRMHNNLARKPSLPLPAITPQVTETQVKMHEFLSVKVLEFHDHHERMRKHLFDFFEEIKAKLGESQRLFIQKFYILAEHYQGIYDKLRDLNDQHKEMLGNTSEDMHERMFENLLELLAHAEAVHKLLYEIRDETQVKLIDKQHEQLRLHVEEIVQTHEYFRNMVHNMLDFLKDRLREKMLNEVAMSVHQSHRENCCPNCGAYCGGKCGGNGIGLKNGGSDTNGGNLTQVQAAQFANSSYSGSTKPVREWEAAANFLRSFEAQTSNFSLNKALKTLAENAIDQLDSKGLLTQPMARHLISTHANNIPDVCVDEALRFSRSANGRIDICTCLKRLSAS